MAEDTGETLADGETIQGLWRALLRYVPKSRRDEAWAIANTLHYFLTTPADKAIQEAKREGFTEGQATGYNRGFTMGTTAGRLAERGVSCGLLSSDEHGDTPEH